MPRSLKKGPFVDAHLFAKVEAEHKAHLCEDGRERLSLQSDAQETLAYIFELA
jgi:ribosomal protein S19